MPKPRNITGRDGYVIGKALAYAIGTIQSLPESKQEYSDMLDMCAILKTGGSMVCAHALSVANHTGKVPVVFPDDADAQGEIAKWVADIQRQITEHVADNSLSVPNAA